MADNSAEIMAKVMKLLDLAADQGATPAERELAAEHAERLMAKHMIDRMDAERAARAAGRTERKPEQTYWDIRIGIANNSARAQSMEYGSTILQLAADVLTHCNVRIRPGVEYVKDDHGKVTDYSIRRIIMVGYAEDITYADRIWFRVYKEFITNVNPSWLPGRDKLGENVHNMQRAGYKWDRIWKEAWAYQQTQRQAIPDWAFITAAGRCREVLDPHKERSCPALKSAAKEYCASIGQEYQPHTQRHEAYKTSFARSFQSTMKQRLDRIRREASTERGEGDDFDRNRYALAVVDTKERVDAEFYKLFPEHDPEVQRQRREAAEAKRAAESQAAWDALTEQEQQEVLDWQEAVYKAQEAEWAKQRRRARRNYGTYRESPTDHIDNSAWERGRQAANRVNLRNDGEVHENSRDQLAGRKALS